MIDDHTDAWFFLFSSKVHQNITRQWHRSAITLRYIITSEVGLRKFDTVAETTCNLEKYFIFQSLRYIRNGFKEPLIPLMQL